MNESATLTALENAELAVELEQRARTSAERLESLRVFRAMVLSRDLATCEQILRGGKVPLSRLDPRWAKAYGI